MQQILQTFTDRHTSALFTRQVASLNKLCRAKAAGLVRLLDHCILLLIHSLVDMYAHMHQSA